MCPLTLLLFFGFFFFFFSICPLLYFLSLLVLSSLVKITIGDCHVKIQVTEPSPRRRSSDEFTPEHVYFSFLRLVPSSHRTRFRIDASPRTSSCPSPPSLASCQTSRKVINAVGFALVLHTAAGFENMSSKAFVPHRSSVVMIGPVIAQVNRFRDPAAHRALFFVLSSVCPRLDAPRSRRGFPTDGAGQPPPFDVPFPHSRTAREGSLFRRFRARPIPDTSLFSLTLAEYFSTFVPSACPPRHDTAPT